MPILFILSLLLTLFVGDIIKSQYPNYDENQAIYEENLDEYNATVDMYESQRDEETITEQEYFDLVTTLREDFTNDNQTTYGYMLAFYFNVLFYFLISYTIINYFYHLIFKGQTYGRKIMKIELYGKINWYTLLLREVLWKTVFWTFSFTTGIAIDMFLIAFTKKKKTLNAQQHGEQHQSKK